ncbi:hypothetical protein [Vibrio aquimaris]|uniref:Uncharacterized protein n=1 Tax=Vibrio aquimaris TaxID=2587862 RepID=A0A5P9CNF1_9VIBR|nr:hypothetical protein [Vibrio aquimaris]QFT27818.1 hypothetical protein FIV01_15625 [Vibrio aquimaris]
MAKQVNLTYIGPKRADVRYHLEQLKPAFNGSECAKAEWLEMVERVQTGSAALYQAKADDVLLRFVGRVIDGTYHINAMAGHGLRQTAPVIIERCLAMGYTAISYNTYRAGMGRILLGFGFELDKQLSQAESRYMLDLGGVYG